VIYLHLRVITCLYLIWTVRDSNNEVDHFEEVFIRPSKRCCQQSHSTKFFPTHLHLVPRSRMRGAIPQLPLYVFISRYLVKHRDNFTFYRSHQLTPKPRNYKNFQYKTTLFSVWWLWILISRLSPKNVQCPRKRVVWHLHMQVTQSLWTVWMQVWCTEHYFHTNLRQCFPSLCHKIIKFNRGDHYHTRKDVEGSWIVSADNLYRWEREKNTGLIGNRCNGLEEYQLCVTEVLGGFRGKLHRLSTFPIPWWSDVQSDNKFLRQYCAW
jgi:hypothetical protein